MRKLFVPLMLVFILWGCASTGSINSTISSEVPLSNFKTLSIDVQSKVKNTEDEVKTLKELLITELKKKNHWDILENHGHSQLTLLATITDISKVGTASRLLFGALAGRASVNVDVVIRDNNNNNVISQFSVTGKSSGGTIFAGTTNQALEKAVEQIVSYLEEKK